jgi:hypothetical protein
MMTIPTNAYQLPQVWYHGTTQIRARSIAANNMNLGKPDDLSDFGPGFYLTSNLEQAKIWAGKKANAHNKHEERMAFKERRKPRRTNGSVVEFQLDVVRLGDPMNFMSDYFFDSTNDEWGRFILGNRCSKTPPHIELSFHNKQKRFDYVYGPMADGSDIWGFIADVEDGDMSEDQFVESIRGFSFPNEHQLSVHTEKARDCFTYRRCITVAPHTQRIHGARR